MIKVSKSILVVMLITILSRITGLIRELSLATVYGTTFYTDAYSISTAIPSVIFSSLGIALETIFIPTYLSIRETHGEKAAKDFTNSMLNVVLLITVFILVLSFLFLKPIVSIFAVGFEGKVLEITINFTKVLLPGIIFIGLNHIFAGFLEANRRFGIPSFINIPGNILIIAAIFMSSIWNINILLYATLSALILQAVIQGYFAFKEGYSFRFSVKFKDKNILNTLLVVVPVFIGTAVQQLNILIDKTLASTLGEGNISSLDFADKLNSFVYGVFIASITTVVYPMLSRISAGDNKDLFKDYIVRTINIIIMLMMPITVIAMCLSTPIVQVLFERGNFDSRATAMTSGALFFFSIGMLGFGLRSLLVRAFYSLQDTKTPVINGIALTIINISLSFLLSRYMGNKGIALATSISALLSSAVLFYKLRFKIGPLNGKEILKVVLKVCTASIFMAAGVMLLYYYILMPYNSLPMAGCISLFLSIMFGGLIYLFVLMIMDIKKISPTAYFNKLKGYLNLSEEIIPISESDSKTL